MLVHGASWLHTSNHFGGCFSSVETDFSFVADALVAVDLGDVAAAADAAWPHQQSNNATMRMLMRLRGYFAVIVSYLKYVRVFFGGDHIKFLQVACQEVRNTCLSLCHLLYRKFVNIQNAIMPSFSSFPVFLPVFSYHLLGPIPIPTVKIYRGSSNTFFISTKYLSRWCVLR